MKPIIIFLFFLLSTSVGAQQKTIHKSSGIEVVFEKQNNMFPSSWYSKEINAVAVSLKKEEIERSKKIILHALDKYPASVLKKNLRKVYVLEKIEFYHQVFGGTNSSDVVYVTNNGFDNGYTDAYIEKVFHAEFSSILLRNFPSFFDSQKWLSCNADDVDYLGSGVEALKKGKTGQLFSEELLEMGILNEYGLSDIENDFNSFAKNIFLADTDFWKLKNDYDRIACKLSIIIAFYNQLDKTFTEKYFREISNMAFDGQ